MCNVNNLINPIIISISRLGNLPPVGETRSYPAGSGCDTMSTHLLNNWFRTGGALMDEVEDNDYEEELLDYDDNEKAPDSVNNKSGAETVKKYASIFSSSLSACLGFHLLRFASSSQCWNRKMVGAAELQGQIQVIKPPKSDSGTFGSDFVYGYSDGLQFVRIKNGEAHDCLVCSQYLWVDIMRSFRAKSYGSEMFTND
ncbi:hypothetical protein E3N88_42516 [Mikania micrantha]|uniref:Uncharacterized protein n=1 Tax=Mikania micrantha TaxID=192012 RepID=A0A5N6LHN0_9ASTR|nr:hypothetical protein E3N88_42516 [Mikania micrantha]